MRPPTKLEKKLAERGYRDVRELKNHVCVTRPDGFTVFLDKVHPADRDARHLLALNKLRLTGGRDAVILAVGLFRGYQIARSYAESHSHGVSNELLKKIEMLLPPGEM